MTATIVALIPARGGSKRVPRKNLAPIKVPIGTSGYSTYPLLAFTIAAAVKADIFNGIYVSTDDDEIAVVARRYGAQVIERPAELAADLAPDIGWVTHALDAIREVHPSQTVAGIGIGAWRGPAPDAFAILRPTSPFRSAETIRAAWEHLQQHGSYAVDSLRAVEPCKQHPFKMWRECGEFIAPFYESIGLSATMDIAPPHSMPTQAHSRVLAQNASLEMAWTRVAEAKHDAVGRVIQQPTISGTRILPWTMPGYEGFDINSPDDLEYARWLVETGRAKLPEVAA